jgi:ribonuclease T2
MMKPMLALTTLALSAVMLPTAAGAQAMSCAIPRSVPPVHAELPSDSQPARTLPVGSYTLAISWSPQYCREHSRDAGARFQCGSGNDFGFVLHGLWADGYGKEWPQYCRAAALLPRAVLRRNMCATPSAQLLQHEWAKHGTCMPGYDPNKYFAQSTGMYRKLRFPDMDALSRAPLTAGGLAQAIARANPGIGADMMRITTTKQGWLDEVWLCTDTRFRYVRCPAHQGGTAPGDTVRIWRGKA